MKKILALLALLALALAQPALAQFPDQRTWAGSAGGTANAITISVANWTERLAGVPLKFLATASNSATTTVSDGLGATTIKKKSAGGLTNLAGGEIVSGQFYWIVWDGTQYELLIDQEAASASARVVTSAPTVTSSDCSGIITLSGSAFYNVSVGAASGYPLGCRLTFLNADATAGKGFSPFGLTACRVLPLQQVTITNGTGSAWGPSVPCYRWATNSATFYVNAVSGSDAVATSDCLGSGARACATFAKAIALAQGSVDAGPLGSGVTIQADCEGQYNTQTVAVSGAGKLMGSGTGILAIVGNPSSPASCIFAPNSGTGTVFDIEDGAVVTLNGWFVTAATTVVFSRQFAIADVFNFNFGNIGTAINAADNGSINILSGYAISGNSTNHIVATGGGHVAIGGNTVTLAGSAIGALYTAVSGAQIESEGGATNFTGNTSGTTGTKWNVGSCGVVTTAGSTLPSGLSAGNPASPGQFACGSVN